MLKTYAIEVRVPKVLVTLNAINITEARKLALEKVQEQILGAWPRNADIGSVALVAGVDVKNMPRKSKDYIIRFTYGRS